jgi:8-oxo-dGTP diphosphatase
MPTPDGVDTADVVLFAQHNDALYVLLVQRADDSDAYPGRWALPGGYIEPGESSGVAAQRELTEETGISDVGRLLHYVGRYDAPGRDPRGQVVSDAYAGTLPTFVRPNAGSDAKAVRWTLVADVLQQPDGLAFDHGQILRDAVAKA